MICTIDSQVQRECQPMYKIIRYQLGYLKGRQSPPLKIEDDPKPKNSRVRNYLVLTLSISSSTLSKTLLLLSFHTTQNIAKGTSSPCSFPLLIPFSAQISSLTDSVITQLIPNNPKHLSKSVKNDRKCKAIENSPSDILPKINENLSQLSNI